VDPALVAALAGVIGLALGRFWDIWSERRRWRRDHRIRLYEQLAGAYYESREAYRSLALAATDALGHERESGQALDRNIEFNRTLMAVMLHASGPAASAAHALDLELNKLFMVARSRQLSWEEWRESRGPAERAMEKFMETVRHELRLPALRVEMRVDDLADVVQSGLRGKVDHS
jgi:hypothetical protein